MDTAGANENVMQKAMVRRFIAVLASAARFVEDSMAWLEDFLLKRMSSLRSYDTEHQWI